MHTWLEDFIGGNARSGAESDSLWNYLKRDMCSINKRVMMMMMPSLNVYYVPELILSSLNVVTSLVLIADP